jgi:hypothetical protein
MVFDDMARSSGAASPDRQAAVAGQTFRSRNSRFCIRCGAVKPIDRSYLKLDIYLLMSGALWIFDGA